MPPAPPVMPPQGQSGFDDGKIVEHNPRPHAARDVRTDEWAAVTPPGTPLPVVPPPVPGRSAPPAAGGTHQGPGGPPIRPQQGPPPVGPGMMPGDAWETAPLPPVGDEYQGRRRRLRNGSRLSAAGWTVVSGVVLLLCAAVGLPFLLSSHNPVQSAGAGTTTPAEDIPTSVSPSSGLPVIGISGITQTPTLSQTGGVPTSTAPSSPATTIGAPPFQTLTLEAENYGTPYQKSYYCNNVKGVRLGANGSASAVNFGTFTAPDQATYTVTVYADEQMEETTVPVAITIDGNDTNWSVSSCGQTDTVQLPQLSGGSHSVVVTFKGSQTQSVLIDKIVIARP
jgi:hypothetical protein